MAEERNPWASYKVTYADDQKWINITTKDAIICKELIQIGPGNQRIYCNKVMKVCRLEELAPTTKVKCASLCNEIIDPKTRWVAICRNFTFNSFKGHCSLKMNLICKECIEKHQQMPLENRKYDIIKNYI